MIATVLPALPAPDPAVLSEALSIAPTADGHARLAARLPALSAIEYRPPPAGHPLAVPVRIAAWNAERCKYGPDSAALLAATGAELLLLSEVDVGMARSGNRHTVADLAASLRMGAAFGVEFVELGLGDNREQAWHAGQANAVGFHGNAILARAPLEALRLIRLDDGGVWFTAAEGDQRRLGWRMALAAQVPTAAGPLVAVSVHLESKTDAADRADQIARLLAAVDRFAGSLPVVIGGDLNTNGLPAGMLPAAVFERPDDSEPLFGLLRGAGYGWAAANTPAATQRTRPDGTPPPPFRRLDWLFTRGLTVAEAAVVPAVDGHGRAISDHEAVVATLGIAGEGSRNR